MIKLNKEQREAIITKVERKTKSIISEYKENFFKQHENDTDIIETLKLVQNANEILKLIYNKLDKMYREPDYFSLDKIKERLLSGLYYKDSNKPVYDFSNIREDLILKELEATSIEDLMRNIIDDYKVN